jgi:alcohol dehydrogenase
MPEAPVRPTGRATAGPALWSRTVPDGTGHGRTQEVMVGPGAAAALPRVLAARRPRSILVVHGSSSFAASGAARLLSAGVPGASMSSFHAFSPNPSVEDVERAVAAGREAEPDVVLGVGGGSAMDVAKCVAVLAPQAAPARRCLLEPEAADRPRVAGLVLAPTVAGSGSEVTGFATVYVDGRKRSLDRPGMRADVAVVDPGLTRGVPVPAAVSASLDALCHAVESMWSARGTEASRAVARLALRLACHALGLGPGAPWAGEGRATDALAGIGVSVDAEGGPAEAWPGVAWPGEVRPAEGGGRTAMSVAATLAGLAIDATRTTAAHAFSYPLTARFGVPHGAACALNLQWLLGHNAAVGRSDCRHPLGPSFVREVVAEATTAVGGHDAGGGGGGSGAVETLREILARGGFGWWLGAHGVRRGDVGWLVEEALASDRAGTNPRDVDAGAARAALERLVEPEDGRPA